MRAEKKREKYLDIGPVVLNLAPPSIWINVMSRRKTNPRSPTQRRVKFNLVKEVRYIQRRAGERDARFVTVGELAFFSCESGDAWMLDPSDHFAAQIARDGDPEPIDFEETDTTFAILWKGHYHIDGEAFVYTDETSGRVITIFGYPFDQIGRLG